MSFDFAEYRKQRAERLARGEKKYPDAPVAPVAEVPHDSPAPPVIERDMPSAPEGEAQ